MGALRKLFLNVQAILMLLFVAVTLLAILPVLTVVYLIMRPIAQTKYLWFASTIQGSWICLLVFLLEYIANVELRITGSLPTKEPSLFISNHLTHDWVVIYSTAFRTGTLSTVRVIIKNSIKYVPFIGVSIAMCYWPFVSRDFNKDVVILGKLFGLYKAAMLPAHIWIFPEGTRLTPSKLKSSQEHAAQKGYPVWNNVMLPRYRGFVTALNSMKATFKYICDVTIQYEGWSGLKPPGFWQIVTSDRRRRHTMHVHIQKHNMADVPEDDEGRQQWLKDTWTRKEKLLQDFQGTKTFPGANLTAKKIPLPVILKHVIGWAVYTIVVASIVLPYIF
jgi:1-acyl-sn-glycerol-3-phosphate acyltransferase